MICSRIGPNLIRVLFSLEQACALTLSGPSPRPQGESQLSLLPTRLPEGFSNPSRLVAIPTPACFPHGFLMY